MTAIKRTSGDYTILAKDATVVGALANVIITSQSVLVGGNLYVTGSTTFNSTTTSTVNTITAIIDSFPAVSYRSANYLISVSNSGTGEYQTSEVMLIHNGVGTINSTMENIYTGGNTLVLFSSNISSGTVNLLAIGAAVGNTVKMQKTYVTV